MTPIKRRYNKHRTLWKETAPSHSLRPGVVAQAWQAGGPGDLGQPWLYNETLAQRGRKSLQSFSTQGHFMLRSEHHQGMTTTSWARSSQKHNGHCQHLLLLLKVRFNTSLGKWEPATGVTWKTHSGLLGARAKTRKVPPVSSTEPYHTSLPPSSGPCIPQGLPH